MRPEILTVGPFTWAKADPRGGSECWDLVRPEGVQMTAWSLKDYGGIPGPGFRGWKLVCGGPFDSAGSYATREEAMEGVVPWLLEYVQGEIDTKLREAEKLQKALLKMCAKLNG